MENFQKINEIASQLTSVQGISAFVENVHNIKKCNDPTCQINSNSQLKKVVFDETESYHERTKFILETCV